MKHLAGLVCLLALFACKREQERAQPTTTTAPARLSSAEERWLAAPVLDIDADNLLNMGYGASLVSRTGELNLENAAAHAIDGFAFTIWTAPPGTPQQTLTFALGGPSRVEQLGVSTSTPEQSPESVRFSASNDGKSWREVLTMKPAGKGSTIEDVKPFEARYLRIETLEPKEYFTTLTSVHAIGAEVRPGERISFTGCYTVNGFTGALTQRGARVTGILGGTKLPAHVDGGVEGRVAKFMWMRGAMWGYAAATVTPGAREISAVTFHQEARVDHSSEAWIGTRCDDAEAASLASNPVPQPTPADFLKRAGQWSIFGLIFDAEDRLVAEPSAPVLDDAAALLRSMPAQKFRIIAYEFRGNTPEENVRRATVRMNAVRDALRARGVDVDRIDFVARGNDRSDAETPSQIQRMLWSRIDVTVID